MANVNDPYSQDVVTPAQRGRQIIGGRDGNAFDAWEQVPEVQNAHDQQAAPTHLWSGPLDNNTTNRLAPAPVSDRGEPADVSREADLSNVVIYPASGPLIGK